MKPISEELKKHMANEVTTLATCLKITRRDGEVIGFTSYDKQIYFDGIKYHPGGFVPNSIASNSNLSVDSMEIEGVIDGKLITSDEILAGLYDYAYMEVFFVNYQKPEMGVVILRSGRAGEIKCDQEKFAAEIRGLTQNLAQNIGELFSPSCRAEFCDKRCGLNISSFTKEGSVTLVLNNQQFKDAARSEENSYFNMGTVTFKSGKNKDISIEVKEFGNTEITTVLPFPYPVSVGDMYSITAGCNKSFATCGGVFNNALNFRGEPHVPGIDAILKTAGTL